MYWKKGEFKGWILLLCAYHFFPFITMKGSIILYVWAYAIPLIYIVLNLRYLKKIISIVTYSEVFFSAAVIVVLTCLSILIPILHGTNEFSYLTEAIMTMVKILFRMLFVIMVIMKNIPDATKETFMKYFIFSTCLYICSTVIMLLFPGIKEVFWRLIKESAHAKSEARDVRYSTRYGWAGFSGFEYTFKCVLAVIFNNYLIQKEVKKKNICIMIGVSLFLIVGTLFYGRIGSLFSIILIIALFLILLKKRPKIWVIAIVGGAAACVGLFVLQSRSESVRVWFEWAFDLFVTFARTGKLQTGSSNVLLQKMLFIPEIRTILIGDGVYTTAKGYYMSTDAGIMRSLLFGGIGFALLRYLSLYGVIISNWMKAGKNTAYKWLCFWMLLLNVVFEIKGEILFSCLPIFVGVMIMNTYEERRKKDGTRSGF